MRRWMYKDPCFAASCEEDGKLMKDSRVRTWAKRLSEIHDRAARDKFLTGIPEEFRDAVQKLARSTR